MQKICQSCGMPMKMDDQGGGTNADGSKSKLYCSHCYQNGEFTNTEIKSGKEMQAFVRKFLVEEKKMNKIIAWFLTLNIPRLERWRR